MPSTKRFLKCLTSPVRLKVAIERRSLLASTAEKPAATIAICMACS